MHEMKKYVTKYLSSLVIAVILPSVAMSCFLSNYYGVYISCEFVKIGFHYDCGICDWETIRISRTTIKDFNSNINNCSEMLLMSVSEWGDFLSKVQKQAQDFFTEILREETMKRIVNVTESEYDPCYLHPLQAVVVVPDGLPGGEYAFRKEFYPHSSHFQVARWLSKSYALMEGTGLGQEDGNEMNILILDNSTIHGKVSLVRLEENGSLDVLFTTSNAKLGNRTCTSLDDFLELANDCRSQIDPLDIHAVVANGNFNESSISMYRHFDSKICFDRNDDFVIFGAALVGSRLST